MSFIVPSRVRDHDATQVLLANQAVEDAARESEIRRRVQLEITRLRAAAETEGHAQGYEAGLASAAPERAALQQAANALQDAFTQLAAPLANKEADLADLVTELAFTLAAHITGVEAATNPAALQTLVTKLLHEAAAERTPDQTLLLRLNPADHARIAPHLPSPATQLLPDASITPGGAIAELLNPTGDPLHKLEWNATVEARTTTIRTALGLGDAP